MMRTLACHTAYRTAAPVVVRVLRRFVASQRVQDCGYLALAAAGGWAVLRLLWIIATAVKLLVC